MVATVVACWHRAGLRTQGCAYEEAVWDDITVKARCSARLHYLVQNLSFPPFRPLPCTTPAWPPSLAGSRMAPRSRAVHPLASLMLSLQGRLRENPNRSPGRVRQRPGPEKFLEAGFVLTTGMAEKQPPLPPSRSRLGLRALAHPGPHPFTGPAGLLPSLESTTQSSGPARGPCQPPLPRGPTSPVGGSAMGLGAEPGPLGCRCRPHWGFGDRGLPKIGL